MSRPIIEVENLSKCYRLGAIGATSLRDSFDRFTQRLRGNAPKVDERDFWALRDVSFTVQPGEVVGIIGRNGAGKSTLLKILSRITEPTAGRAVMRGRVASLLEVGTGFHPDLTGRENIFLNGAILGMKRAEVRRKFDEIVAFAEVEKFIDTPVKRYSSGMYVRLAFAVAAHLEPEILIIDEVLAVGDAAFQKKCLGKMDEVAREGRTVVFVSHIESSIRRLCSRVVLIQQGTIHYVGSPEHAFRKYRGDIQHTGFSVARRVKSSDQIRISHAELTVDGLTVESLIEGTKPNLIIQIAASDQITASLEVILKDADSIPLMFGPVGLAQGFNHLFAPGPHLLSVRLNFPYLAEGRYALDLLLVESGIRTFDQVESAIVFEVLPTHNANTGWRFKQATGQGSILLETSFPIVSAQNGAAKS